MRTSRSKVCFIAITAIVATVTVGCRGDDVDALPSPTVGRECNVATCIPTTSPAVPLRGPPVSPARSRPGRASVTATGGVNATATYDTLFTPGIWTLPPGAIALSWRGAGRQAVSITGPSFTAQLPTDVDRVLEFSLPGPDGLLRSAPAVASASSRSARRSPT